jgi:transposase
VYDETAKSEFVALCLRPGASVSRLARECGVNANQVSRWLREHGHVRRSRKAVAGGTTPFTFMAIPVVAGTAATVDVDRDDAMVSLQVRLPNGVAVELRGVAQRHVGDVIQALGRLRCSASAEGLPAPRACGLPAEHQRPGRVGAASPWAGPVRGVRVRVQQPAPRPGEDPWLRPQRVLVAAEACGGRPVHLAEQGGRARADGGVVASAARRDRCRGGRHPKRLHERAA